MGLPCMRLHGAGSRGAGQSLRFRSGNTRTGAAGTCVPAVSGPDGLASLRPARRGWRRRSCRRRSCAEVVFGHHRVLAALGQGGGIEQRQGPRHGRAAPRPCVQGLTPGPHSMGRSSFTCSSPSSDRNWTRAHTLGVSQLAKAAHLVYNRPRVVQLYNLRWVGSLGWG